MTKQALWILIAMLLISSAIAECQELPGTGIINTSMELCSDTYDAQEGIKITADNVELNCGTAVLRGNYQEKIGITIENRRNVTITRCNVLTYNVGVFIRNSTNVHLYDNALLKNDVGLRMYNSYENLIEKHNDKSLIKPVSAINSKFNIVMLGNKNIEREFCEENACNVYKEINPCVDNDFYCSTRCNPETDNDCKIKEKNTTQIITPAAEEPPLKEETIITEEINTKEPKEKTIKPRNFLVYAIFYIIGLSIFQFIRYVKKFDIEDM
ncbi:hypothetical protein JW851_01375 [Candidatus Woesearchaeota archaeon]|nr:hypothetical protein [Candidatus Woesearchaeota archaeon]